MKNIFLKLNSHYGVVRFMCKYPATFIPLLYFVLSKLIPFLKVKVKYISDKYELKKKEIQSKKNIGNARGEREYRLLLFDFKISKKKFAEGEVSTFLQFYLFRPTNDIEFLINNLINNIIDLKNKVVFEPGCGTGKHLMYLNRKFGCSVYGVDSYKPCINIANFLKGENMNNIFFKDMSALDIDRLDQFIPVKVDIIYMNSYLNHIFHHENYLEFIEFLSRRSKYIALIINKKYMTNIDTYMPYYNLIKVLNKDTTSYTIFKSNFF